jgi:hypothetical protein
MTLSKPKFPSAFRRSSRRLEAPAAAPAAPADAATPRAVREPDEERARAETAEPGWRASSYDLKHGLDVVELPTSLPPDVLDRLFNEPPR